MCKIKVLHKALKFFKTALFKQKNMNCICVACNMHQYI